MAQKWHRGFCVERVNGGKSFRMMVRLARFERATFGSGDRRSSPSELQAHVVSSTPWWKPSLSPQSQWCPYDVNGRSRLTRRTPMA